MSEMMSEQVPLEESVVEAEPSWSGPSQDEWSEVTSTIGQLAQYIQSQQAPEEEPFSDFDPFDPQQLAGFIQQQVQQSIAPVTEWTYQQQLSEAEERALDILDDISSREGEFMDKERGYAATRALANVYFAEEAQRYGNTPKAAETALQRAAADVREYEQNIRKAAIEQHMNQLTNLSGAPREPGIEGIGAQTIVTEPGGDELSLVRKYGGFPGSH